MAEYIIIGGSRKNPAVEKMNFPKVTSGEKAGMFLAEMKRAVLNTNCKAPDIPLSFRKNINLKIGFKDKIEGWE